MSGFLRQGKAKQILNSYAMPANTLGAASALDTITASSGGTQSGALALKNMVNRITVTVGSSASVKLPPAVAGLCVEVVNSSSLATTVYGNDAYSDTVNDTATGTGVVQMSNSVVSYVCTTTGSTGTAGKWYGQGLGAGYNGSLPTQSYTDSIIAASSSTPTPLTTVINRVTTIASSGRGVQLPTAAPGLELTVINAASSNPLMIYAASSNDTIDGTAGLTGYSLANPKSANFYSTVTGAWHKVLSA